MKSCEKYDDLMAALFHGGVRPEAAEELARHAQECPRCRSLRAQVEKIDRVLRDLPDKTVEPSLGLRERIMAALPAPAQPPAAPAWGFGRWAAFAGGLAACVLAVFLALRGALPRPAQVASVPPPAPLAAPTESQAPPAAAPAAGAFAGGAGLREPPRGAVKRSPAAVAAAPPAVKVVKEVRIYFYYPPAREVAVTGDFNGWDPKGVPLAPAGKPGLWTARLRLPPGAYSYNFIVDGDTLVPDPNAPAEAPDGYGGTNSIMLVKKGEKRT